MNQLPLCGLVRDPYLSSSLNRVSVSLVVCRLSVISGFLSSQVTSLAEMKDVCARRFVILSADAKVKFKRVVHEVSSFFLLTSE